MFLLKYLYRLQRNYIWLKYTRFTVGKWRYNLKIMPRRIMPTYVYSLASPGRWRMWVVLHNSQRSNLNTEIFGKTWNSYATAVWKKLTDFPTSFWSGDSIVECGMISS